MLVGMSIIVASSVFQGLFVHWVYLFGESLFDDQLLIAAIAWFSMRNTTACGVDSSLNEPDDC